MASWRILKYADGKWHPKESEFETLYGYYIDGDAVEKLGNDWGLGKYILLSNEGDRYQEVEIEGKTYYSIKEKEENTDEDV
jgi:hypothetical protein